MRALSAPIRLRIFDMLSCGEMCASAIQEYFSVTQSTLSYHIKGQWHSGIFWENLSAWEVSKVLGVSRNTVAEMQTLFLQSGKSWYDI